MDTGVSYAIIPSDDFITIKDMLNETYHVTCTEPEKSSLVSTYKCKCPDFNSLPDIQISLQQTYTNSADSKVFTLPRESYMERVDQGCGTFRLTPSNEKFGAGDPSSYWVLGDIITQV